MTVLSEFLLLAALAAPQDLVLDGATVHTGTSAPWRGPVVVRGGRIQPPGTPAPEGARVLALRGAHVYPGLVDAHAHVMGLGAGLETVDLVGTRSFAEVVARVAERARTTAKGEWILGRGWDQNDWDQKAFPSHAALSAALPDHPVLLTRIDGHAALANARAMAICGVSEVTKAPSGGEIVHDEQGRPTGVLVDTAMGLVQRHLPAPTRDQRLRRLRAALDACVAAGLTQVHDAGVPPEDVALYRELHSRRELKLRVYVMLPESAEAEIRKGPWGTPDQLLIVRAVKGYADGALGSRGAALLEPYSDRSGFKGLMIAPRARVQQVAQLCADAGFQLCVHAIGDRANREVLDAFAATTFPDGREGARFRVEHAQVVAAADFVRFRELAVLPSMQPTHLTSDMPWAPERLGPERVLGAYAWRSFLALGLPVAFGSDFPVESHDPRLGLYAAVTTRPGPGAEPLRRDQILSREEALRGFTLDACHAAFLERELGTIEAEKRADLTVFDRDLLSCPEDEIRSARVLATVVGGRVVHTP